MSDYNDVDYGPATASSNSIGCEGSLPITADKTAPVMKPGAGSFAFSQEKGKNMSNCAEIEVDERAHEIAVSETIAAGYKVLQFPQQGSPEAPLGAEGNSKNSAAPQPEQTATDVPMKEEDPKTVNPGHSGESSREEQKDGKMADVTRTPVSAGYFRAVNKVFDMGWNQATMLLCLYIHRRANKDGETFFGMKRATADLRLGRATIQKSIRTLQAAGAISVKRGDLRNANIYKLKESFMPWARTSDRPDRTADGSSQNTSDSVQNARGTEQNPKEYPIKDNSVKESISKELLKEEEGENSSAEAASEFSSLSLFSPKRKALLDGLRDTIHKTTAHLVVLTCFDVKMKTLRINQVDMYNKIQKKLVWILPSVTSPRASRIYGTELSVLIREFTCAIENIRDGMEDRVKPIKSPLGYLHKAVERNRNETEATILRMACAQKESQETGKNQQVSK